MAQSDSAAQPFLDWRDKLVGVANKVRNWENWSPRKSSSGAKPPATTWWGYSHPMNRPVVKKAQKKSPAQKARASSTQANKRAPARKKVAQKAG